MKHFIVATAGHVDHGKSALVKALTGTDPDRLPEEKARGMTIDLGFAELNLGAFHIGIVDVPGHDAFVRNMIAGVGSIDLALFVVAADDGWMPQTEEHLQILAYLGINHAVFALTKIDIGDSKRIEAEMRAQLRDTAFADSPIIPISVRADKGFGDLKRALISELSKIEPQRDIEKPRLFVDRTFKLRGIGTVVTGTLTGGTLHVDESIFVQPRNFAARIRSLQTHGQDVDLVQPGMRTAINLPDLEIGRDLQRGDVVTTAGFEASATLGVSLDKSPRSGERPLKNRALVYLHHGTSRVRAKVVLPEKDSLHRGEQAIGQLHLESAILAFLGDRFVLRDPSERLTIAGGVVLDPDGNCGAKLLRARASAHDDIDLCVASEIAAHGALKRSAILHKSRFTIAEVNEALQRLHASAQIFLDDQIAAEIGSWRKLRSRAMELIDQSHQTHSQRAGLELNELRAALRDQTPDVVEALVADLCGDDFIRARSTIARRTHRSALPPAMEEIAKTICERLSVNPFDSPARKQIAPDSQSQAALRFLIEQGDAIEIAPDVILSREAFVQMKATIAAFLQKHGTATVSQLRQEIQTSRRIMVPMLELLDAQKVTRRAGDKRVLA